METGMQEVGRLVEQEADPVAALLTAVRAAAGVLGLDPCCDRSLNEWSAPR